jgi:DNA/RNA-binding domain of Phe-tRNA-synthetase-like protein
VIQIDPVFAGVLRLGVLEMDGVRVRESPEDLKSMIHALAGEISEKYKGAVPGQIPAVRQVREIFHRAGVDPTRYHPSSESLFRRALSGKGLYLINSAVDLVNYFSLKLLFPMGLYDMNRVRPPIELRVGRRGESYEGIGRQLLNLTGFPLLADADGPFGSPVSDSTRTCVTPESTHILWITFAPPGPAVPMEDFAEAMTRFSGGALRRSIEI